MNRNPSFLFLLLNIRFTALSIWVIYLAEWVLRQLWLVGQATFEFSQDHRETYAMATLTSLERANWPPSGLYLHCF